MKKMILLLVTLPLLIAFRQPDVDRNAVRTQGAIALKMVSVQLASGCNINTDTEKGDWIESTSAGGTGICTINIKPHVFTVKPSCVCNTFAGQPRMCDFDTFTANTLGVTSYTDAGAAISTGKNVMCLGF